VNKDEFHDAHKGGAILKKQHRSVNIKSKPEISSTPIQYKLEFNIKII
jgi:hypothetical protein